MKLIKLNDQYYLLSDDEAYPYAYHKRRKEILKIDGVGETSGELHHEKGFCLKSDCMKLVASTQHFEGIPMLDKTQVEKALTIDIETLALEYVKDLYGSDYVDKYEGFVDGYKKALKDNADRMFTLAEMNQALSFGYHTAKDEAKDIRSNGYGARFLKSIQKIELDVSIEEVTIPTYSKKWDKMIGEIKPKVNEQGYITIKLKK